MQGAGQNLQQEFTNAYDEYLQPIYRYFYYRLNDRERAKDLAQETFMKSWLYVQKGGTIENMKPFLYTTAGNLFKNELRDRKPVMSLEALTTDNSFEIPSEETSAEEIAEARLLMSKLDRLPPAYQEVLTLRFVDGLPPREIAEVLQDTDTAVSVRIHRALKKLREIHETSA